MKFKIKFVIFFLIPLFGNGQISQYNKYVPLEIPKDHSAEMFINALKNRASNQYYQDYTSPDLSFLKKTMAGTEDLLDLVLKNCSGFRYSLTHSQYTTAINNVNLNSSQSINNCISKLEKIKTNCEYYIYKSEQKKAKITNKNIKMYENLHVICLVLNRRYIYLELKY